MSETNLGLSSGGIPVGAVFRFPDNLPVKIETDGATWVRSGFIETDQSKFDLTYWATTRATMWAKRLEYSNRSINGASANGNTIVAAISSDGTSQGGVNVSTNGGITWGGLVILPAAGNSTDGVNAVRWISQLALWVAVGTAGQVWTSPDAVTWTFRSVGISTALRAIEYANNLLVIVGNNGVILTSTNGTSFTSRTSGLTGVLISVAFYNGVWLTAESSGTNGAARSTDNGASWQLASIAGGSPVRIFTGSNMFIAVLQGGTTWQSATGSNGSWTQVTAFTSAALMTGSYNGEFYIFANQNTLLYKTSDLLTSRTIQHGVGGNSSITFLNIRDGQFLACGVDSGAGSGRLLIGNLNAYAGSPYEVVTPSTQISGVGVAEYARIK